MTRAEIEAHIMAELRAGTCPNPACRASLNGAAVVRSGTAADRAEILNGKLTHCKTVLKIVRCPACAEQFRCEQPVPEALYKAAYGG